MAKSKDPDPIGELAEQLPSPLTVCVYRRADKRLLVTTDEKVIVLAVLEKLHEVLLGKVPWPSAHGGDDVAA